MSSFLIKQPKFKLKFTFDHNNVKLNINLYKQLLSLDYLNSMNKFIIKFTIILIMQLNIPNCSIIEGNF